MGDVAAFVEPSFVKRVAEVALEEYVRRLTVILAAGGVPTVTEAMTSRLEADEKAVQAYFSSYHKGERLAKHLENLAAIRELVSSAEWVDFENLDFKFEL